MWNLTFQERPAGCFAGLTLMQSAFTDTSDEV